MSQNYITSGHLHFFYDLNCLERYFYGTHTFIFIGPTSFAPIIEMAMTIVEESGGQYHVLLIIADGQVNRHKNIDVSLIIIS